MAIALQQPWERSSVWKGCKSGDTRLRDVEVLDVLYEIAPCRTFNLLDHISLIDLPYTTEKQIKLLNDDALIQLFTTSTHAICGQGPDVSPFAGKVWLGDNQRHCKGSAWKLETRGIGETFDKYPYVELFVMVSTNSFK